MNHLVLLGDSIFDNGSYVPGGPPVIDQVRGQLPPDWQATLRAVDGDVVLGVVRQLAHLPDDATHLVVSAGGNDALENSAFLERSDISFADGFAELAELQAQFRHRYREMLRALRATGKPTVVCTIYDAIPGLSRKECAGLALFNDVIVREASRAGAPILDLRELCDEHDDYSPLSPIEPSRHGGIKIAAGIARVVTGHVFARSESVLYGK